MSKDRLFEEAAFAVTAAAQTPLSALGDNLPVLVPWEPIHQALLDFAARADAREAQREADGREQDEAHVFESLRANKAEGRCRRMRIRIQELERRPTISQAAATLEERDALKAQVDSLEKRMVLMRADLTAMITVYEQEPEHVAAVIQAIRERPNQVGWVDIGPEIHMGGRPRQAVGPTEEALARAREAHAAVSPRHRTIVEYNFDQALLEATASLAKRMDSAEGDAFNILKALKKLEGG